MLGVLGAESFGGYLSCPQRAASSYLQGAYASLGGLGEQIFQVFPQGARNAHVSVKIYFV